MSRDSLLLNTCSTETGVLVIPINIHEASRTVQHSPSISLVQVARHITHKHNIQLYTQGDGHTHALQPTIYIHIKYIVSHKNLPLYFRL